MPFFPTPYPGELFYSIIARFQAWAKYSSKWTLLELFALSQKVALVLPNNLLQLYERLPSASTVIPDYLINNHSILRILYPFVKPYHLEIVINAMKAGSNSLVSTLVGREYRYISDNLKICPDCVIQDEYTYGEPYWHLFHQLRGVWFCHRHGTKLLNSDINVFHRSGHRIEALTAKTEIADVQPPILIESDFMHEITKNYLWLMNSNKPYLDRYQVNYRYRALLKRWGFMSPVGALQLDKVYYHFANIFPEYYLQECNFYANPHYWLYSTISPRKKVSHPLRHITLVVALEANLKDFYEGELGHLEVREQKLCVIPAKKKPSGNSCLEKREKLRCFFSFIVALFPGASRTQLRRVNATGYFWLWENDRDWFEDNMPIFKPNNNPQKWIRKDIEMANLVEMAAKKISNKVEPARVYTESLKRETGLSILKRPDDLERYPLTNETLSKVIETSEHFRLRRLRYKYCQRQHDFA